MDKATQDDGIRVRLDPTTKAQLKKWCRHQNVSESELVRRALAQYFEGVNTNG